MSMESQINLYRDVKSEKKGVKDAFLGFWNASKNSPKLPFADEVGPKTYFKNSKFEANKLKDSGNVVAGEKTLWESKGGKWVKSDRAVTDDGIKTIGSEYETYDLDHVGSKIYAFDTTGDLSADVKKLDLNKYFTVNVPGRVRLYGIKDPIDFHFHRGDRVYVRKGTSGLVFKREKRERESPPATKTEFTGKFKSWQFSRQFVNFMNDPRSLVDSASGFDLRVQQEKEFEKNSFGEEHTVGTLNEELKAMRPVDVHNLRDFVLREFEAYGESDIKKVSALLLQNAETVHKLQAKISTEYELKTDGTAPTLVSKFPFHQSLYQKGDDVDKSEATESTKSFKVHSMLEHGLQSIFDRKTNLRDFVHSKAETKMTTHEFLGFQAKETMTSMYSHREVYRSQRLRVPRTSASDFENLLQKLFIQKTVQRRSYKSKELRTLQSEKLLRLYMTLKLLQYRRFLLSGRSSKNRSNPSFAGVDEELRDLNNGYVINLRTNSTVRQIHDIFMSPDLPFYLKLQRLRFFNHNVSHTHGVVFSTMDEIHTKTVPRFVLPEDLQNVLVHNPIRAIATIAGLLVDVHPELTELPNETWRVIPTENFRRKIIRARLLSFSDDEKKEFEAGGEVERDHDKAWRRPISRHNKKLPVSVDLQRRFMEILQLTSYRWNKKSHGVPFSLPHTKDTSQLSKVAKMMYLFHSQDGNRSRHGEKWSVDTKSSHKPLYSDELIKRGNFALYLSQTRIIWGDGLNSSGTKSRDVQWYKQSDCARFRVIDSATDVNMKDATKTQVKDKMTSLLVVKNLFSFRVPMALVLLLRQLKVAMSVVRVGEQDADRFQQARKGVERLLIDLEMFDKILGKVDVNASGWDMNYTLAINQIFETLRTGVCTGQLGGGVEQPHQSLADLGIDIHEWVKASGLPKNNEEKAQHAKESLIKLRQRVADMDKEKQEAHDKLLLRKVREHQEIKKQRELEINAQRATYTKYAKHMLEFQKKTVPVVVKQRKQNEDDIYKRRLNNFHAFEVKAEAKVIKTREHGSVIGDVQYVYPAYAYENLELKDGEKDGVLQLKADGKQFNAWVSEQLNRAVVKNLQMLEEIESKGSVHFAKWVVVNVPGLMMEAALLQIEIRAEMDVEDVKKTKRKKMEVWVNRVRKEYSTNSTLAKRKLQFFRHLKSLAFSINNLIAKLLAVRSFFYPTKGFRAAGVKRITFGEPPRTHRQTFNAHQYVQRKTILDLFKHINIQLF